MRVQLEYRGHITVEIDADPEDTEGWVAAIGEAWSAITPERLKETALLVDEMEAE